MVDGLGYPEKVLDATEVRQILADAFGELNLTDRSVLVVIPDNTRSGPIDLFFRELYGLFGEQVRDLDYLIALGTHPPLPREDMLARVGVTGQELAENYPKVTLYNHRWDQGDTLTTAGVIPANEVEQLSEGMFSKDIPVRVNRMIYDYDLVIICGPVFPHEVVGFSGGNKYFFPGISGQEVIDTTHWLGALITSNEIIGTKHTPVRAMINRAVSMIDVPAQAICFVAGEQGLCGVYAGDPKAAWSEAADLSAQIHVKYLSHPYSQVLSVIPEMYDDLWTGAKGMYKTEPVVADGGEVILYAPHITEFSYTHGDRIESIGYHVKDYFVKQWDRFRDEPWGVLAHSTHLRGIGEYDKAMDQESPRIQVTLATGISRERCEHVNLGYRDPADIDPGEWIRKSGDDVLVVPKAGERLYRLEES